MQVEINNVAKSFGHKHVLQDVTTTVNAGQWLSLVGISGTGKSTLLNIIAGVLEHDSGFVRIDNSSSALDHSRVVAYLQQDCPLYPSLTVEKNLKLAESRAYSNNGPELKDLISIMHLKSLLAAIPSQLSGGERQRVALARTLLLRRPVLLLDEPFSNIDVVLRHELRSYLIESHCRYQWTVFLVTHDQEDAVSTSDLVGFIDGGRLTQVAPPQEVFRFPVNARVAENFGDVRMVMFQSASFVNLFGLNEVNRGALGILAVRETDFEISITQKHSYVDFFVKHSEYLGSRTRLYLEGYDLKFTVVISSDLKIQNSCIWLKLTEDRVWRFQDLVI